MNTELRAVYDRNDELEAALKRVRKILTGSDPFDIIDRCLDAVDAALAEKTVLA